MRKTINIIIVIFVLLSCKNTDISVQLRGVWIGAEQFFFNPDSNQHHRLFYPNTPFLLDFQNDDSVTLKIFGYREYRFSYSVLDDSTLRIKNHLIHQLEISDDTLLLSFNKYQNKLYRANKTLLLDSSEVINKLCSFIWSDTNVHPTLNTNSKPESYIEYLLNHAKIKKYPFPSMDTTEGIVTNIELWMWTLDNYKDYYFLFETEFQPMPYNYINLITILNDSILELYRPYTSPPVHSRYHGFKPIKDNYYPRQRLLGKWISQNKRENKYSLLYDNRRISRREKLYQGPFTYIITNDQLTQFGENTQKWTSNWTLNKDQTVLLNDFISESEFKGDTIIEHYLTASEIKKISNDTLILRLCPNYITSAIEPYHDVLLNVDQMFIRIK